MGKFFEVVAAAGKYGKQMIDWVWANKGQVLTWLNASSPVDWIILRIRNILGL